MKGLPESFDIARRIGLILFFPLKSEQENKFDSIYLDYQNEYPELKKGLLKYRSECKNKWSQNKCRLGLPQPTARISLSKYMRIAHGLSFIEMQKIQNEWLLKPTPSTYLINIIWKLNQSKKNDSYFELSHGLKLFFAENLLKQDEQFIIPILKSLKEIEVSSETGFINSEFLTACANNLFKYSSKFFDPTLLNPNEIQSYIRKIKFFELNQSRILSGEGPTRGFLHVIEPRIHWLIDLLLIDPNNFCRDGVIKPANFLYELINENSRNYENFSNRYSEYLFNFNLTKTTNYSNEDYIKKNSIDLAINELKVYYPKLIPLNMMMTLVKIIEATKGISLINRDSVSEILYDKYEILRDWNPNDAFIDIRTNQRKV